MSPVRLLCEIIAQSGNVAAITYREFEAYGDLLRAGLVHRQGLIQSVLCEACDLGHDAVIRFEDGVYGHLCPEAGFVSVERSDLIAVVPDIDALIRQIAEALDCGSARSRRIGAETWHIGQVKTDTATIAVYLHPRLQSEFDLNAIESALRTQVTTQFGLVLTACGNLTVPGMTTALVDQVFGLGTAQHHLTTEVDLPALVGAPIKRKGGRPGQHGDRIKRIIADRAASGRAETGKNAEIRAIQREYVAKYTDISAPKRSTVAAYIPSSEGGR